MANVPRFQDTPPKPQYQVGDTGMTTRKKAPAPDVAAPVQETKEVKAPPPNLFSGKVQNLQVHPREGFDPNDPIPGFRLFWFPDDRDGIEIARAQASGWVFVTKDEVGINEAPVGPGNTAPDDHVRRWLKYATAQGVPVYGYLMKKPEELCRLHDEERESYHRKQEESILAGGGAYNTVDRKAQRDLSHMISVGSEILKPR